MVNAEHKAWLFTIADRHGRSSGGARVAEVDLPPVPVGQTYEFLVALAILWPGADVGVHIHSGPEAWYVLAGEQCLETAARVYRARAGQTMVAPAATPMKLVITGSSLRRAFFIVLHDAAEPWISDSDWQPKGKCAT